MFSCSYLIFFVRSLSSLSFPHGPVPAFPVARLHVGHHTPQVLVRRIKVPAAAKGALHKTRYPLRKPAHSFNFLLCTPVLYLSVPLCIFLYLPSPIFRPPAFCGRRPPASGEEALPSGPLSAPMRPVSSRKGRGRVPQAEWQPSPLPHASSRKRGRPLPPLRRGLLSVQHRRHAIHRHKFLITLTYSSLPSVAAYRAAASASPVSARLTASGSAARASPAQGSSSGSAPA